MVLSSSLRLVITTAIAAVLGTIVGRSLAEGSSSAPGAKIVSVASEPSLRWERGGVPPGGVGGTGGAGGGH